VSASDVLSLFARPGILASVFKKQMTDFGGAAAPVWRRTCVDAFRSRSPVRVPDVTRLDRQPLGRVSSRCARRGHLRGLRLSVDDRIRLQVPLHRAAVHQAAGMVSVQASISINDALTLIRASAFAESCAVGDLAASIVDGNVRFDD
jgi:hypothetical protein